MFSKLVQIVRKSSPQLAYSGALNYTFTGCAPAGVARSTSTKVIETSKATILLIVGNFTIASS